MRIKFLDEATDDEIPTYDFSYIQDIKREGLAWALGWQLPIGDMPEDDDEKSPQAGGQSHSG